jgi:hypothetical protein
VKSAGKNFGIKIVWYVALPAQAAPVQAADKEELRISELLPLLPSYHLASHKCMKKTKAEHKRIIRM